MCETSPSTEKALQSVLYFLLEFFKLPFFSAHFIALSWISCFLKLDIRAKTSNQAIKKTLQNIYRVRHFICFVYKICTFKECGYLSYWFFQHFRHIIIFQYVRFFDRSIICMLKENMSYNIITFAVKSNFISPSSK